MKIALCISGQPKFFKKSYEYIYKNLICNFDQVDIFCHCWEDLLDEEKKDVFLKLYKPKKYIFQKSKIHILNYPFKKSGSDPNNVFSMFYSIKHSNFLKKEYEKENNFLYDWVFRLRFDFALNKNININTLNELNKDYIYLNNFEKQPNPHCADCFAFGSSKNMDTYSETYDNIMKYGYTETILAGEAMLYRQIIENNINIQIFDINHAFQPDYSTCWCRHSLIRS